MVFGTMLLQVKGGGVIGGVADAQSVSTLLSEAVQLL